MTKPTWQRLTIPSPRDRADTLDRLGAPDFTGLVCPACKAGIGVHCRGPAPHQARIDRALRMAYWPQEQP